MKKSLLIPMVTLWLLLGLLFGARAQDLILTGVFDGPISGNPKAIELYVVNDISDLSVYGVSVAANGAASAGSPGYTFPADAVSAGTYLYVASEQPVFNSYFGFDPDYTYGSLIPNGDDVIELYLSGSVYDVYGVIGEDGTGMPWEYLDGWAYRNGYTAPASTFTLSDWTLSGINATDGETTNATAASQFPIGTFTLGGSTVNWCNLQWPDATTVNTDEAFNVYARVYEPGVTEAAGQGAGIECWIGYSTSNTDPSAWTDWVVAAYNTDNGNNDEYSASLSFPAAGTYYYASRFRLDGGAYSYGGYNVGGGDFWNGTDRVSGVATVNAATTALTLPFFETFETWPLDNWTITGDDAEIWESSDGTPYGPGSAFEGSLSAMFNVYDAANGNTTTMTTDVIDMNGAINPTLEFQYWMNGSSDVDLWIKAEMSTDGSTWTQVFYKQQDGSISDWTKASVILTGTTATTQVRIIASSDYGSYNTFVDDLSIKEVTCPDPSTLTATNITATSADLAWTENGGATTWNIEWGATGFTQGTGTLITGTTDNPYNLTGLSAVTAYDFYVQSHCGVGDESAWIGPFSFTTPVSCPVPTSLFADNITISSASLNWTENGTTDTWNLKVSSLAIDPGTQDGDIVVNESTMNNPYTSLSGLTSATTYYFYVQSDCGSGDLSEWSAEGTFTTACEVENIPTASQSFELSSIPVCWTTELISGTTNWTRDDTNDGVSGPHTGTYFMGKNYSNSDALVYSQPINISSSPTGGRVNVWIYRSADNYSTDRIRFHVNTTASLTGATQLLEIFPRNSVTPVVASSGWYNYIVDIPATFNSSPVIYIIAQGTTSADYSSYGLGFDDFLVEPKPSCPDPSTLTATNITATSADLAWTENGGATTWNIEWGADGFSQGSGTVITETTDNPYNLTGLSAVTAYDFYVQSHCGVGDESAWIGPFSFTTPVSCLVPTSLFADNITISSASLNWTENGTTDTWNLKVSSLAIDPETQDGDIVVNESTMSNPYTSLSGLTSATTYYFYVQSDCGSGDLSEWSAEGMFTTECTTAAIPYSQDFESAVIPSMPSCTSIENAGTGNNWDTYLSSGNGFTSKTLRYLYNSYNPANAWFYTQGVDLTAGTSYRLTFRYGNNGGTTYVERLKVAYGTSANSTDMTTELVDLPNITNNVTPIVSSTDFTPSVSGTYYIGFNCYSITDRNTLFVDDILIDLTPACLEPTALSADNITTNSASLNWTENGSATSWNIVAATAPFDPAVSTGNFGIITTTDNPLNILSGTLTPNTTYYWYVRADCGGDVSEWSTVNSFTTECDAVTVFPYTENFDGDWGTWCWEVVNNDADSYTWHRSSTYITPHSGSWTAHGMGNNDDYLITPQLVINSAYFTMDWWDVVEGSGYNNTYDVLVSTTDNSIASFTDNLGTFDCSNTTWTLHNLDLSAYDGQSIYIAFHQTYSAATNWGFGIDDLTIREISDANDILTFSFAEQTATPVVIDDFAHTVAIEVVMGTDPGNLTPTFTISDFATVDYASGIARDFSVPVTYIVTSELGTDQPWIINTTVSTTQSSEKDILTFTLDEETVPATIGANTVDITVNFMADVTNLTPAITISDFATISPASLESVDFTNPVTYTVTAEDESTKDYTVTVTKEITPAGATCATAIPYTNINDPEVITAINAVSRELWFTVTLDQTYVDVDFSTCASVYDTRLYIYDACGGNLLADNDDDNIGFCSVDNNQSLIQMESLAAGTYYIRITPYDNSEDISDPTTGLYVSGSNCGTPNSVMASNMSAISADIIWTPVTEETTWNLKVSSTSIDPTTDAADIFDGVVTTTPSQALSGLTAETGYYVYVQAACGSDWTSAYTFTTPSTCPVPVSLNAIVLGANDATLIWDELGTSDWVIEVSTTQLTDPSTETGDILDNVFVAGSTGQYDISGLTANTTYYWYVMSDCGSAWSAEGSFHTNCNIFTAPYFYGFEDSEISNCWTIWNIDADAKQWTIGDGDSDPYEGSQTALISYNAIQNNDWLITPQFDITSDNIMFDFYANSRSDYFAEDFNVLISTTGTDPSDFTIVVENIISHPDTWEQHSYNLSDYGITSGQQIYIAIQCVSQNEFELYIDAFEIKEIPQIASIDINNDATDISVCLGTDEATAVAGLATQITITDTEATEYVVNVTWTIDSYDANTAADYNATGTFTLPAGVAQTATATPLEVNAVVTVNDLTVPSFSFGTEYCLGSVADALPTTSDNSVTGTWAPETIATDVAGTATYIFTADAGQCADNGSVEVTVNALPVVTCPANFEVTDINAVALTGGSPADGVYTGTGVTAGEFSADGLANGDYTLTYTYTDGTTGCSNFCDFTVTVNIAYPAIADIDVNNDVENVAVCLGAVETDAIALLASQITIEDAAANQFVVDVTWTIASFDGNTAADYNATGTFELPATVSQTDPVTPLEVTAVVTVNSLPVVTCPETMAMTSDDGVTALTGASPAGGVYSGTNVTDNNFDPSGLAVGSYVITYTYTDATTGCVNSCDFNIDIVTGIETVSLEGIKVYPNPNSGEFTVNFSNIEGNVTYQIYDTKGSIIVNENIFANANTVKEVSLDLVPGIYYVKVITAKQSYVEKLVVE